MKKVLLMLALIPLVMACAKEEKLERKMEGNNDGDTDDYGLSEKDMAQIQTIKSEIMLEVKKGDSIVIASLRNEIDSLKQEVHALKHKK